jgi:hypothetical protein
MQTDSEWRPAKNQDFIKHLEATSERVRKWPAWKRNQIGPVFPEDRQIVKEEGVA